MRRRNYKGRCVKRKLPKCKDICKTYDDIQYAFVDMLMESDEIIEFSCNTFPLEGLDGDYTSDVVAKKNDGTIMVRECVFRHH